MKKQPIWGFIVMAQLYAASCAQPVHKSSVSTNRLNQIAKGRQDPMESEYTPNPFGDLTQMASEGIISLPDVYASDHRVRLYVFTEPEELCRRINFQLFQQGK